MKKVNLIFAVLCLMTVINVNAQTTIPNVLNLRSAKQSGEIIENDKLVGYFVFYFKEKTDSKNATYEVQLFDDNYNSVKNFEITRPKNSSLLEMVYNGSTFLLFFYDSKTGYEFTTFNREGEQKGSLLIPKAEIAPYDLQKSAAALASASENVTIYPLGDNGFVRQTFTKNKKMGYELVAYDNEMNELWKNASAIDSKLYETIEISEVSEKYVTATIYRKTSAMTRKMNLAFLIVDASNGKQISELSMGSEEEGKESVLNTYVDSENNKIILIGEFYAPGDDILKDKSKGLFVKELSSEGVVTMTKQYNWKGDIDAYKQANLSEEDAKEAKETNSIFFHNVIRSKNGHLFLVGEQFRKQVSAGGIASNMASKALGGNGNAAMFEIRLGNMVVIELDEKNKMVDYKIVNKKKSSVILQEGMGLYGSAFLGYYVNSLGAFDYAFTASDKENDAFTVVYIDADRRSEKGEKKADKMLGVIHVEGGKLEEKRMPINTDAKTWWIQPAKPGYISVTEYYKKEKRLELRLEKLVY